MDLFFQDEILFDTLWPEIHQIQTDKPEARQSAFVPYTRPSDEFSLENWNSKPNRPNLIKRAIEILRTIQANRFRNKEPKNNRCYRHMMSERQRRDKMRKSYSDLHSMLPPGTKADKKSVVQMTAIQLQKLQGLKEDLQRRQNELVAILARDTEKVEVDKINLRVVNPTSSIDSMIGVLKCLKNKNVKAATISSNCSNQELSASIEIEKRMATTEVAKAVENALMEVERK
ncbi:basic helix-loop-helix (bHLH) DNA-binding superfamily protein [Tasmannia lanceolata]|uniref:basic helix-loop-helix (bHLH) DNA-binding superfamily protein n=1 Tax=Tasmannia lanceolata TaxID=3420 RepID=UPI004062BD73